MLRIGMARIRTYSPLLVPRLASPLLLRTRPVQFRFRSRYFESSNGFLVRCYRGWNVGVLVDYA